LHGEIVGFAAVLGIFVIPSLAIFGRFVVRPILDTILKARQLEAAPRSPADDARLTQLEERMTEMQESLERLSDAVDFHMRLQSGAPAATARLPRA
jgi:hypothetical protein